MKNLFLLHFFVFFLTPIFFTKNTIYAQKLDFGLNAGIGKLYIHEQATTQVSYGLPTSLVMELKYTPNQKSWGIKLRASSLQASIKGMNWDYKTKISNAPSNSIYDIDGAINTFSTNILLEKEYNICAKLKAGFNFGFGITKETLENPTNFQQTYTRTLQDSNIMFGGVLEYKISSDFGFQFQPTIFIQDTGKCFGVVTRTIRPQLAGEDVSFFANIGVVYRLRE
jgi:hypothetical protein